MVRYTRTINQLLRFCFLLLSGGPMGGKGRFAGASHAGDIGRRVAYTRRSLYASCRDKLP